MDNNPTQPTEPQPQAPVQPAPQPAQPAQPAQPVQPVQPGTPLDANGQPIVYAQKAPKQPMDPAKKKKLILGLSLGGGALIIGIIATVVLINIFKIDYDADYDKIREFSKSIDVFSDGGDYCYKVKSMSSYTDASDFDGYVSNCKEELEKGFAAFNELGNLGSVKRDAQMNEEYKKAQEAMNSLGYDSGSVEPILNQYKALQGFYSTIGTSYASYASWSSLTDSDLEKAAGFLTNSGNESLASFGTKWLDAAKKARKAYVKYYKEDTGSYSDYRTADNDYDKVCEDAPDDDNLPSLTISGANETKFDKAISELKSLASGHLSADYYKNSIRGIFE